MKRRAVLAAALGTAAMGVRAEAAPAAAAECYSALRLAEFRPASRREVVIAVDETTVLGPSLGPDLIRRIQAALRLGDQVSVVGFAGLSRTHHAREVLTRALPPLPPDAVQDEMPMRRLKPLQACLVEYTAKTREEIGANIAALQQQAEGQVFRSSEIVLALRGLGDRLRHTLTPEKLLIVVSDGAENSDLMSFYKDRILVAIDPEASLAKVKARGLLPSFKGVRVVMAGIGVAPDTETRKQSVVLAVETFWRNYFAATGADAVTLGSPNLLGPIG